ncbi:MAG: hypothetical protein ACYC6R_06200 [Anaerolineales bacterium]
MHSCPLLIMCPVATHRRAGTGPLQPGRRVVAMESSKSFCNAGEKSPLGFDEQDRDRFDAAAFGQDNDNSAG